MQVVYSGGSTPTPSPRLQRKAVKGYGRPVLPGYFPPTIHHTHASRPHAKEKEEDSESSLRDSIPAMSKPMAIICLILNILFPGLGTVISGLSVLCCSKVRLKDQTKQKVVLVNSWVAFLQFVTSFILLLGWIWSIVWGTSFITYSREYYILKAKEEKKNTVEKEKTNEIISTKIQETHEIPNQHNDDHLVVQNGSYSYSTHQRSHSIDIPGSTSEPHQPIIVLQELPLVNHVPGSFSNHSRPIMNARTRHEKILRRQMSDNELSPFNLTQEQLKDIVIHAAPIPRYRSNPDNSIPEYPRPTEGPSSNLK